MANKLYEQIHRKLTQLKEKKDSVINVLQSNLNKYEEQYKNAITHTTSNSDADTYVKAMETKDKAKYYVEYYSSKIKQADDEMLLSDGEYNKYINDIRSEQKRLADDTFNKIVKLLNEVFSIYESTFEQIQKFNELIAEIDMVNHKPAQFVVFQYAPYDFIRNNIGTLEHKARMNPTFGSYFAKKQ